jgi:cytochrome P450
MVAGHDTTSFMLASTLYYLATHPAAKARLVAEVDAFGPGRPVEHGDLEKFPYVEVRSFGGREVATPLSSCLGG